MGDYVWKNYSMEELQYGRLRIMNANTESDPKAMNDGTKQ